MSKDEMEEFHDIIGTETGFDAEEGTTAHLYKLLRECKANDVLYENDPEVITIGMGNICDNLLIDQETMEIEEDGSARFEIFCKTCVFSFYVVTRPKADVVSTGNKELDEFYDLLGKDSW